MKLLIIDANALLHRVYHALPRLTDPQGRPIQAVYGLANILLKIITELKPDYIFSCWDRPEPTFRHRSYKEYKITRPPLSEDLKSQIPLAKRLFQLFNIPIVDYPGYEADDIIATLKEKFQQNFNEIIILTGDLDTLQLVDEKTKIYTMKKGISEMKFYDISEVKNRFGIMPSQIVDYKALVGDPSDNIKGIPGIGFKTAAKLLEKFSNIEGIIEAAEKNLLEIKFRRLILENKDNLLWHKNLLTLVKNVDIKNTLEKYSGPDFKALYQFFQELGFKSLLKRIEPLLSQTSLSQNIFRKVVSIKEIDNLKELETINRLALINLQNKIYLYDGENTYLLSDKLLKNVFFLDKEKIVWDLKKFYHLLFNDDFYFDKKINLDTIFDFKILFWLTEPNLGKYTFSETISFLKPDLPFNEKDLFYLQYIFDCYERLKERINSLDLMKVYKEIELPLVGVLVRMEKNGIKIDKDILQEVKTRCFEEIKKLREEINKLAGFSFNPLSPKELRYVLFEKLKISAKGLSKTAKGSISTQESDLQKIANLHPIVEKILEYRKLIKIASTYTDSLLVSFSEIDKRIHPTFLQTATTTGRLASENPNVQNIPLEGDLANLVRKAFKAEDSYSFLAGDYSQLELRLAAHLSGDENLIKDFQDNIDVHTQTAKIVFGVENNETRKMAKIINFSIIYGTSSKGLAESLRMSISEAQKIIERYFKFYPGLKKMREELIEKAKTFGYAETLFGRKLLIPEIYSQSYREKSFAERIAINMPIQGLGADILKKAMIDLDDKIYKNNWKEAKIILSIHDEIILEVKEDLIDKVEEALKKSMENVVVLKVPLLVKIKEGKNLAEIK